MLRNPILKMSRNVKIVKIRLLPTKLKNKTKHKRLRPIRILPPKPTLTVR